MKLSIRGKIVLGIIGAVIITVIIGLSVLTGVAERKDADLNYFFYTVESDDTVWSIACENTPEGKDVRETVYEILTLNNIKTEELRPGMRLAIFNN